MADGRREVIASAFEAECHGPRTIGGPPTQHARNANRAFTGGQAMGLLENFIADRPRRPTKLMQYADTKPRKKPVWFALTPS